MASVEVCLISLNFNLLCQSLRRERKSHFTVCIFVRLPDCSLLKVIKYCQLHTSEERGREREIRGNAHLHLYLKWQMQMAKWSDKRKMWIPLCSYLQIKNFFFFFFPWAFAFMSPQNVILSDILQSTMAPSPNLDDILNHLGSIFVCFVRDFSCFVLLQNQHPCD